MDDVPPDGTKHAMLLPGPPSGKQWEPACAGRSGWAGGVPANSGIFPIELALLDAEASAERSQDVDTAPGRGAEIWRGTEVCDKAGTGSAAWVPWSLPQEPVKPEPPGHVQHVTSSADQLVSLRQEQRAQDLSPVAPAWIPGKQGPNTSGGDHVLSHAVQQHTLELSGPHNFRAAGWRESGANACTIQPDGDDCAWTPDWPAPGMARPTYDVPVLKPGKPMDIPIEFDFFTESDSVAAMLPDEVAAFRVKRLIKTSDGCPRPVVTFADAGFPAEIADEIAAAGFTEPTPIQSQGWPLALRGLDLVGIASTGSGKTLAFMLPALVHALAQPVPSCPGQPGEGPIVLVLAPTRELACQIRDECTRYMRGSNLNCVCIYGGASRQMQIRDVQELRPHAIIATPGRLLDLLDSGVTTLARVTYLVLDEADRMLEMGFKIELDLILSQVRSKRQTIMTSATWPADMVGFAKNHLRANHKEIHIGRTGTASMNIDQRVIACSTDGKYALLEKVLHELMGSDRKILVFVRTKRGTEDVARAMRRVGYDAETMHGDRSQQERDAVIMKFRRESTMLLFATDVAQRGLDVKGVSHVVNFDLPDRLDDYIHRIGRTGRAGVCGSAVSFCCSGDAILPSLVKLFDESKLPVPTEVRALSAACFGNTCTEDRHFRQDSNDVDLAGLKKELHYLSKLECHPGGNSSTDSNATADSSRMLVGNLPTSLRPMEDVQKFVFEKELRKLFAFCGPIAAIGFETRTVNEEVLFTGTVVVDFKVAADAAYAVRMYDGYTMTSGNPLGTRLQCALAHEPPRQEAPKTQPLTENISVENDETQSGPSLQEYLQAGIDVSKSQDDALADPEAAPEQILTRLESVSTIQLQATAVDCARMKSIWKQLTGDEQSAAERLGWSGHTWDAGHGPTAGAAGWATLNDVEQLAAKALGYTQQVWDAEIS